MDFNEEPNFGFNRMESSYYIGNGIDRSEIARTSAKTKEFEPAPISRGYVVDSINHLPNSLIQHCDDYLVALSQLSHDSHANEEKQFNSAQSVPSICSDPFTDIDPEPLNFDWNTNTEQSQHPQSGTPPLSNPFIDQPNQAFPEAYFLQQSNMKYGSNMGANRSNSRSPQGMGLLDSF